MLLLGKLWSCSQATPPCTPSSTNHRSRWDDRLRCVHTKPSLFHSAPLSPPLPCIFSIFILIAFTLDLLHWIEGPIRSNRTLTSLIRELLGPYQVHVSFVWGYISVPACGFKEISVVCCWTYSLLLLCKWFKKQYLPPVAQNPESVTEPCQHQCWMR